MGATNITRQEELEQFYAFALPGFLDYLARHSGQMSDLEVVSSLDGITSMPAYQRLEGVEKTVLAPLNLLTKDVDSQIEATEEAIRNALEATAAAQNATEAAETAAEECHSATQSAREATTTAQTATGLATTAADKADAARVRIENIEEEASGLTDKQKEALAETLSATAAATSATAAAQTATTNAQTATTNAQTATAAATEAAQSVTDAKAACETATAAAQSATTKALEAIANEDARKEAETARASAEAARAQAESDRETQWSEWESNYTTSTAQEAARQKAETARAKAEQKRASAESERATKENERNTAETSRESAAASRASEYATIKADTLAATQSANAAAALATSEAAKATTAANDANTATAAAQDATTKANKATSDANKATSDANIATSNANEAASRVDTAISDAEAATSAATAAAQSANEASTTVSEAKTAAMSAAASATSAASAATSAAQSANEAATTANEAAERANAAAAAKQIEWTNVVNKPTTLSGYGITDASIDGGTINIGGQSITPLTQHQSLTDYPTKAEVETALTLKAAKTEVDAALAQKADTATMEAALALKATKMEVDAALALKANKSDIYTKKESDNKYLPIAGKAVDAQHADDATHAGIADNSAKVNGLEVKTSVPENAKFTDTIYTVPTLDAVPTVNTLTWIDADNKQQEFQVGYMCRVADDTSTTGYTFYQLNAIEDGKAVWSKVGTGSGGSTPGYEKLTLTVTSEDGSSVEGQKATINGEEYTLDSTGVLIVDIPLHTYYSIKISSRKNYIIPKADSLIALTPARSVSMMYKTTITGIYIQDVTGGFWNVDDWSMDNIPNGVCICIFGIKLLIPGAKYLWWTAVNNSSNIAIENSLTKLSNLDAQTDLEGRSNTENLLKFFPSTSKIVGWCNSFVFPDGETTGHLPSAGELWIISKNYREIARALEKCGLDALQGKFDYWSSSYSGTASWDSNARCLYAINLMRTSISYVPLDATYLVAIPVARI